MPSFTRETLPVRSTSVTSSGVGIVLLSLTVDRQRLNSAPIFVGRRQLLPLTGSGGTNSAHSLADQVTASVAPVAIPLPWKK